MALLAISSRLALSKARMLAPWQRGLEVTKPGLALRPVVLGLWRIVPHASRNASAF
jgi:hypothetical protein